MRDLKERKQVPLGFRKSSFCSQRLWCKDPIQKTPDMHQTFGIKLVSWNGSDWLHWWWGDKAAEVEAMTWTCITLLLPISSWWPRSWWTRVQNQNTQYCVAWALPVMKVNHGFHLYTLDHVMQCSSILLVLHHAPSLTKGKSMVSKFITCIHLYIHIFRYLQE